MLLKLREFDPDIFDINKQRSKKNRLFTSFVYSPHEINKIREYLADVTNAPNITPHVSELLLHTLNFQCYFLNANEAQSVNLLNVMADMLTHSKKMLKTLSKQSVDYNFLYSAIQYCFNCSQRTIKEVQSKTPKRLEKAWEKSYYKNYSR